MIINDSTCGVTFLFECAKKSWFCSEYKMDIDMDLIVSILECSNQIEQASEDLSKTWLEWTVCNAREASGLDTDGPRQW